MMQRMSAGTGVQHTNAEGQNRPPPAIWIEPNVTGIPLELRAVRLPRGQVLRCVCLAGSPDGAQTPVSCTDARLYAAGLFKGTEVVCWSLNPQQDLVQMVSGRLT
jgi:hypothetical protein